MKRKMRRILVLACLIGISAGNAQGSVSEMCDAVEGAAEMTMEKRQQGAMVSTLMKVAGNNKFFQHLVIEAYKVSRYSTETYQNRAVRKFANKFATACYQDPKTFAEAVNGK